MLPHSASTANGLPNGLEDSTPIFAKQDGRAALAGDGLESAWSRPNLWPWIFLVLREENSSMTVEVDHRLRNVLVRWNLDSHRDRREARALE